MKGITDIRVGGYSDYGPTASLPKAYAGWDREGARYHLWFYPATGEREVTIYKNPRRDLAPGEPGYFRTRELDASTPGNAAIVEHVFAEVERLGLVAKAKAEFEATLAAEEARYQARAREHRIAKAAPDLLAALKALLDEPRSAHVRAVARAVIEKAEAEVQS